MSDENGGGDAEVNNNDVAQKIVVTGSVPKPAQVDNDPDYGLEVSFRLVFCFASNYSSCSISF